MVNRITSRQARLELAAFRVHPIVARDGFDSPAMSHGHRHVEIVRRPLREVIRGWWRA